MRFSAPKQITWWVAVILGVLGLIGMLVEVPVLSDWAGWVTFIGFALLALGTAMEGL